MNGMAPRDVDRELHALVDDPDAQGLSAPLRRVQHMLRDARREATPDAAVTARLRARLLREQASGLHTRSTGASRHGKPQEPRPAHVGDARAANRGWLVAALLVICIGGASAGLVRVLTTALHGATTRQNATVHTVSATGGNPAAPSSGGARYLRLQVLRRMPLDKTPYAVGVDPATRRVFVLASDGTHDAAYVLDTVTGAPRNTVGLIPGPDLLLIDPAAAGHGGRVIIASQNSSADTAQRRLQVLDPADGRSRAISASSPAIDAIAGDAGSLYMVGGNGAGQPGELDVRDPRNGRLISAMPLRTAWRQASHHASFSLDLRNGLVNGGDNDNSLLAVDRRAGRAFAIYRGNILSVIDVSRVERERVLHTVALGPSPYAIAVDEQTNRVFIADKAANTITLLDASSGAVLTTTYLKATPTVLAVAEQAGTVFVGASDGTLTMLDARSGRVLTTAKLQGFINAISVDGAANRAYVTALPPEVPYGAILDNTQGAGTLSLVDAATGAVQDTMSVGTGPRALDVDPATGHIFLALAGGQYRTRFEGTLHEAPAALLMLDVQASSAPRPTPTPQPTIAAPPLNVKTAKVVVSASTSLRDARSSFPADTTRFWCLTTKRVANPVTFIWRQGKMVLWSSPPFSYSSRAPGAYGYIVGPFAPGRYSCSIYAHGRLVGTAPFVVQQAAGAGQPTPTPHPANPAPPTQKTAKVVVATSPNVSAARTVFPANTVRYWCLTTRRVSTRKAGDTLTFIWRQGNALLWQSPLYTYSLQQPEEGYIDGPFAPGRYSCTIQANGRLLGTAPFVVR